MDELKDTYRTITRSSNEILFKDRGSKFFGYALHVSNEDEIKEHLNRLKKLHFNARHWCYAWQLGEDYSRYRVNDDGEPSNSAGMPIYGQIKSFELTQILVVVVRYFGGTKLGVGGLINAYRTAAKKAIEETIIAERTIDHDFQLIFDYPEMNRVMRLINEHSITIKKQYLEMDCKLVISTRKKESKKIYELFSNTYKVRIKKME
jgi:uncharacterized YigZ family protein